MARPAHPDAHDERIRRIMESALTSEVLVPCPDAATATLIRSRIREYVRAHKVWQTGRAHLWRHLSTKRRDTLRVLPLRPDYEADAARTPWTLIIDAREKLAPILEAASVSGTPYPIVGSLSHSAPALPDEDDDDPYTRILSTHYNGPR